MYEHSAILIKIEEKLEFRQKRENKINLPFPKDETYLSPRFFKKKWKNTDKFRQDMLDCSDKKDNLYCNMKRIFGLKDPFVLKKQSWPHTWLIHVRILNWIEGQRQGPLNQ